MKKIIIYNITKSLIIVKVLVLFLGTVPLRIKEMVIPEELKEGVRASSLKVARS